LTANTFFAAAKAAEQLARPRADGDGIAQRVLSIAGAREALGLESAALIRRLSEWRRRNGVSSNSARCKPRKLARLRRSIVEL
jgi:hypothetical protein